MECEDPGIVEIHDSDDGGIVRRVYIGESLGPGWIDPLISLFMLLDYVVLSLKEDTAHAVFPLS